MRIPKLVVLRADMSGVERQLSRIADALDRATGVIPPGPEASPGDADVEFSTERDLIKQEIEEAMKDGKTAGLEEFFR